jgi:thioredoxin:protein disulfide reductase
MRFLRFLTLAAAVAILGFPAGASEGGPDIGVAFKKGAVVVTVPSGTHIKKSFTEVSLASKPGSIKAGPMPKADAKDELGDEIYHGKVVIPVNGDGLKGDVKLEVTYQACTEGAGGNCYPPTTIPLTVKASDIPGKAAATPAPAQPTAANPAATAPAPEAAATPAPVAEAAPAPAAAPAAKAPAPAPERGFLLGLLVVFLAGIGASLTPCVYPMIPITMAIIGAKGGGKLKGFSLSMVLVLGMAVTYTVLGVVAARSGATFGAFAQKPAFLIPVSVLFAAFALSLFGAFEIALPQGLQNKLQGGGPRKGYAGAFFMGLVLGPLAAPCVGPIIGTVLVGIAQKGDVFLGGLQLFVFALGMGLLFLAVGTFSAGLPRSGDWLDRLKHFMGLVVLGFAAWNVRNVVPESVNYLLWTLTTLAGAAVLGAFEAAEGLAGSFRKGLAVILVVLAAVLGIKTVEMGLNVKLLPAGGGAAAPAEKAEGAWGKDFEAALAKAKAEKKVVLLDTYAVWCAQCKELDEKTWPDPAVAAWIKDHAVAVRIDADKDRPDLAKTYAIRSFPTVVLMDGDGKEIRRSMGFQQPADMLAWLNR